MALLRLIFALVVSLTLTACGGDNIYDSDDFVAAQRYSSANPPSITLVTVISTRGGGGAHSALVINASERVIFDPAGTFRHPNMPERHDVIFGATDPRLGAYLSYHARVTYYVVVQEVIVTPQVAEMAYRAVLANGAVPKAHCANATSAILSTIPGFESVGQTWSPKRLMDDFGAIPGVSTREIHENDPDIRGVKVQVPA